MSEIADSWYKQRADRVLESINRLDDLINANKANASEKVTKGDLAALQAWVKLSLSNIREIYAVDQTLDRNLHANARFHAVLTERINKLGRDTKAQLRSLNTTIDRRDKETANTLQLILKWKRQSQRTLNRAKEYFNRLIER